jgi:integrase/recombinase XerC
MQALTVVPNQEIIVGQQPSVQFEISYWNHFNFIRAARDFFSHIATLESESTDRRLTRKAYRRDLRHFLQWLHGRFPDESLTRDYIAFLKRAGLKNKTINRYLAPVKIFLKCLARQATQQDLIFIDDARKMFMLIQLRMNIEDQRVKLLAAADIKGLSVPGKSKKKKMLDSKSISEDEANAILARIDRSTIKGKRDYAIFMVGFYSALRLAAIAKLTPACFDRVTTRTYTITVQSKRNNDDPVPLDIRAYRAVQDYVNAYNADLPATDPRRIDDTTPLWRRLKKNGERYGDDRDLEGINDGSIADIIVKYSSAAGTRISPHWMRHTVISASLERGMSMNNAKELANHASIATTVDIYDDAKIDWDRINPATYGYNVG